MANPNDPKVSDVMMSTRIYLNDYEGITWSDAHLLPLVQEAHRELQTELQLNDIPVVSIQVTNNASVPGLMLPAYSLSLSQAGLMPANLIEPLMISERDWGDNTPENYIELQRMKFLPNYTQDNFLFFWTWQEEDILFIGATTARDLQIRYRASLTTPLTANDSVGFLRAERFLGPRAASLACFQTGDQKKGAQFQAQAEMNLDKIIRSNVKNNQGTGVRRIPYRRRGQIRAY